MIDTHCHIFKEYYPDIEDVIKKMGNNIMIVSGTNPVDNHEVLKLCETYDNVYATIGIHPTEIEGITLEDFSWIEKNLNHPKIVGIGEIGLDYHYPCDQPKQKEVFEKQLKLAVQYHKCVVIHSRDAIQDTYDILKKYSVKSIIHCFASSIEMAKEFVKLGSKLGIGGVITFKNSMKLKEVVEVISIENLVLETDSPFLSPEPFRGKRNEPYNVYYVAQKIAEIKGISLEEVLKITTLNSISQFDLDSNLC